MCQFVVLYFLKETFEKNFDPGACRECEQNDADNGSTMSASSNFEPFATDDLGKHKNQGLNDIQQQLDVYFVLMGI